MTIKPIISLHDVTVELFRRRGFMGRNSLRHKALNNITLDIKRGSVLGVIGRNGSGKTTLLRLLAGIIHPDQGTVRRYGEKANLIGVKSNFLNELSGRDNATITASLSGVSLSRIKDIMPLVQQEAGIGDWFDEPISTYSTGMQSRLAFSVANHLDTRLILVDEALGVGDEEFKAYAAQKIQAIPGSDRTMIIVSHDLELINNFAQDVLWMNKGEVVQYGPTQDVLPEYLKAFTEKNILQDHENFDIE